jgi:hypothetical protein
MFPYTLRQLRADFVTDLLLEKYLCADNQCFVVSGMIKVSPGFTKTNSGIQKVSLVVQRAAHIYKVYDRSG